MFADVPRQHLRERAARPRFDPSRARHALRTAALIVMTGPVARTRAAGSAAFRRPPYDSGRPTPNRRSMSRRFTPRGCRGRYHARGGRRARRGDARKVAGRRRVPRVSIAVGADRGTGGPPSCLATDVSTNDVPCRESETMLAHAQRRPGVARAAGRRDRGAAGGPRWNHSAACGFTGLAIASSASRQLAIGASAACAGSQALFQARTVSSRMI